MNDRPTPLDFLQAVYLDQTQPLSVRLRAAIEAAPYMHSKLSSVAVGHFTGQDFAARLDRAIQRSAAGPPLKLIEGEAVRVDEREISRFY